MKPTKGILHPEFRYVPSHQTDIRKRFAAERRRLNQPQPANKVVPIRKRGEK